MKNAALADLHPIIKSHPRVQSRGAPNLAVGSDTAPRADRDIGRDARACPDDRECADTGGRIDLGARVDDSTGMNARYRHRGRVQQRGHTCKISVGIGGDDTRDVGERAMRRPQYHRACLRLRQLILIVGTMQEGNRCAICPLQRSNASDFDLRITDDLGIAELIDQIAQPISARLGQDVRAFLVPPPGVRPQVP